MVQEINTYLIHKMGWIEFFSKKGIGQTRIFESDKLVKYVISIEGEISFAIKKDFKEKKMVGYRFIKIDHSNPNKPLFFINEFTSNIELMKLIRLNMSCNQKYRRIFTLNRILL